MTYNELLSKATTWTARHVAQDELANFGHNATASQYSIDKVNGWQVKEGGAPIQAISTETERNAHVAQPFRGILNRFSEQR